LRAKRFSRRFVKWEELRVITWRRRSDDQHVIWLVSPARRRALGAGAPRGPVGDGPVLLLGLRPRPSGRHRRSLRRSTRTDVRVSRRFASPVAYAPGRPKGRFPTLHVVVREGFRIWSRSSRTLRQGHPNGSTCSPEIREAAGGAPLPNECLGETHAGERRVMDDSA